MCIRDSIHIAESGSFSAAAIDLNLTQPAVSKRIATLEDQFDVRLFDRAGRTVRLTEPGRLLLPKAREILSTLELSKQLIENLGDQVSGNLSIAVTHHIGLHRLPKILKGFRQQYDNVALQLEFMDSAQACSQVESGATEMAVITLPEKPKANLLTTSLWQDHLVFAASADHPLANNPNASMSKLAEYDAILPDNDTYTRKLIDKFLRKNKCEPQVVMETNYLETLRMMSKIGIGWTVLPENMLNKKEMHVFDFVQSDIQRPLGIVRHKSRSLSNAAKAMCEALNASGRITH